ncbi:MAG: HigA family addiction module antidote protein [Anaerolineales bacterium]|nr:HigA family addiction module antidote protein [Anaerolineales bacterium]
MGERRPAEVFHPGEHLLDELNARGWTQTEFAEIISRPVRLVNEIINGKRGITPETARGFGAALGTSPEFWMNLDIAYHLWKTDEDVSPIEHRAKMRNSYPIRDLVLRGWIRPSEDTQVVESQLLRFFEVNSLDERPKLAIAAVPKRSGSESEREDLTPIQIAWLYRVKHIAAAMQVPNYSKKNLKNALIKMMAFRENPEEIRHVPQLLENCGVRFVIVETLPSSKIDGVTFWLNNYSPVIGMSLRFDRIDNFWFVLRHEIEHVLNEHGKEAVIVDSDLVTASMEPENLSEDEKVANLAAAEFCISQEELENFIAGVSPLFSRARVLAFARKQGVHPGLVVGQLQRHLKRYDLFRPMLVSVKNIITPVAMTDGYGHVLPTES